MSHARERSGARSPPGLIGLLLIPVMMVVFSNVTFLDLDQSLYFSVAWHSFQQDVGFWPTLPRDGSFYLEKPPLLFWLYRAGWTLFGPGLGFPKVLQAGVLAASALLVGTLVRRLLGDAVGTPRAVLAIAVLVTVASVSQLHRFKFDNLMMLWILVVWYGTFRFIEGARVRACVLLLGAYTLALLTKGPFVFLYTLPGLAFIALRSAVSDRRYHYLWLALPAAGAAALVSGFLWWQFAGRASADTQLTYLTLGQIDRRIGFTHKGHLVHLFRAALLLAPWSLLPDAWRGAWKLALARRSDGRAYLIANLAAGFLFVLLLVNLGGGDRYILPFVYGALALLLAGILRQDPGFFETRFPAVALAAGAAVTAGHAAALALPGDASAPLSIALAPLLPWFVLLAGLTALGVLLRARGGPFARDPGLPAVVLALAMLLGQSVLTRRAGEEAFYREARDLFESRRASAVVVHAGPGTPWAATGIGRGLFFHLRLRRPPDPRPGPGDGNRTDATMFLLPGGDADAACSGERRETFVFLESLSQSPRLRPPIGELVVCLRPRPRAVAVERAD